MTISINKKTEIMKNKYRVYEIEYTNGIYKSLIGKSVQVSLHEDVKVGDELQVRVQKTISDTSENIKSYDSNKVLLKLGDSFCSACATLGVVKRLLYSFNGCDSDNNVREDFFKVDDYNYSDTVSAKIFTKNGVRLN